MKQLDFAFSRIFLGEDRTKYVDKQLYLTINGSIERRLETKVKHVNIIHILWIYISKIDILWSYSSKIEISMKL